MKARVLFVWRSKAYCLSLLIPTVFPDDWMDIKSDEKLKDSCINSSIGLLIKDLGKINNANNIYIYGINSLKNNNFAIYNCNL